MAMVTNCRQYSRVRNAGYVTFIPAIDEYVVAKLNPGVASALYYRSSFEATV
jgi:hypothetical protein